MQFVPTPIAGAFVVELERRSDSRGYFARAFCRDEFGAQGLQTEFLQANLSFNHRAGTLRGMHYQRDPDGEVKIVRCFAGGIFDVIVDVRPDSPTYLTWFGVELTPDNGRMLYVPIGCAHGYQTLTDGALVHYMVSARYQPAAEAGLRYDDPAVSVKWPLPVAEISPKDLAWSPIGIPPGR